MSVLMDIADFADAFDLGVNIYRVPGILASSGHCEGSRMCPCMEAMGEVLKYGKCRYGVFYDKTGAGKTEGGSDPT
jgi:hypothetical protein